MQRGERAGGGVGRLQTVVEVGHLGKDRRRKEPASGCRAALRVSASLKAAPKGTWTGEESRSGQKWPGPSTHAMLGHRLGTHVLGSNTEEDPKSSAAGGCQPTALLTAGFLLKGCHMWLSRG